MQFHQHVHPGEHHAEPNLWEKIKVFVDALASTQQGAGEMPFSKLLTILFIDE